MNQKEINGKFCDLVNDLAIEQKLTNAEMIIAILNCTLNIFDGLKLDLNYVKNLFELSIISYEKKLTEGGHNV